MNIDDTDLLAYVDGELSPERRAQVEAAAAASTELAQRLAAMHASALPYKAAFERQALPPLPPGLAQRIEDLAAGSANATTASTAPRGASWQRFAAAFVAGALVTALTLKLLPLEWSSAVSTASATPWVKAVADYQVLYTRDTLANVTEDPALSEKVVAEIQRADLLPISVPDLRSVGLIFKRVQRLNFEGHAVVQMVYLPGQGGPVALCVMRDGQPDEAPHAQKLGAMNAVVWRHDRIGYVLLAKDARVDLTDLGRRIANGDTANLYRSPG